MTKTTQQAVYEMIKYVSPTIDKQSWEWQKEWLFTLVDLIEELTPRQFEQIFPIKKYFKGYKYGERDYFSVVNWIDEYIGQDNKIPNGIEFLFEYRNDVADEAAINAMMIINKFHRRQNGKGLIEAFWEAQESK